jgi:hypothetical protein
MGLSRSSDAFGMEIGHPQSGRQPARNGTLRQPALAS